MSARENKRIMEHAMEALAQGDGKPFIELMGDNVTWTITGGSWARSWRGKDAVRRDLFAPLFAQFDGPYTSQATRIIADDDIVVVECRGRVRTKRGQDYNNAYCYVCRFEAGKFVELTEYMDTALVDRVLTPPGSSTARSR
jgi:ketosteroid isomerase-like protein